MVTKLLMLVSFMMFQEKMIQSGTLLDKANELMEEQDDEIKKLNEVCEIISDGTILLMFSN